MGVEDFFEIGVLVGGPFIEQIERAVFEVGGQEGEAFALALRNGSGGKDAVSDGDAVI